MKNDKESSNRELYELFDIEKFQKLQDDLSAICSLAMITIDYKGIPITKHSNRSNFCSKMRSNPTTNQLCEKCDSRGGLEAIRIKSPFIYRCHSSIIDIAIPIVANDKYLGAILAGQVIAITDDKEGLPEKLSSFDSYSKYIENTPLEKDYNALPKMTLEKINAACKLIHNICSYIIDEAISKLSLLHENEVLKIQGPLAFLKTPNLSVTSISKTSAKPTKIMRKAKKYGLLQPAIDYIENNITEKITLTEMANICNISESYFSKLFNLEFNVRFNAYLSDKKLCYGKELLETTDMSISEISNLLNYNDCGYFTRIFKSQYGVTPAKYRKYVI